MATYAESQKFGLAEESAFMDKCRNICNRMHGIYNTEVEGSPLPVWEMRAQGQDKLLELNTEIKMIDDPNMEIYKVIDDFMDSRVSE